MAATTAGIEGGARSVSFDERSFFLDGRRVLILSGSVHYPRCGDPSGWPELFERMRRNGLNCLETYVFWGEHDFDPSEPYDFTGSRDLFGFLRMAGENDLYVILRIGPYICAEANYGGFPAYLRDVPDISFRTFNEPFMDEMSRWVLFLADRLKEEELMYPQGGPIILFQLENEYDMVSDRHGEEGKKYLEWVSGLQDAIDLGVPAIMCYGSTVGVLETINSFFAHELIDDHRIRHPDQPAFWTECWTGWYDVWGTPHHRRSPESLAYAVARFFASGGAGVNYYMYFGGTNFRRETSMYLQATSYDYDAPLDEFGRDTTKSMHLATLHRVLEEHWFPMFREGCNALTYELAPNVCSVEWGALTFLCNDSSEEYTLEKGRTLNPRSVQVVSDTSEVLFDSSLVDSANAQVQNLVPVELFSGEWQTAKDPVGARSEFEYDTLPEQLVLTHGRTDYCWYSVPFTAHFEFDVNKMCISFQGADFFYVYINGQLVGRSQVPLWEDRFRNRWTQDPECPGFEHRIECVVEFRAGDSMSMLDILSCSLGMVKGEWQLEESQGLEDEAKGLLSVPDIEFFGDGGRSGGKASLLGPWKASEALQHLPRKQDWSHLEGKEPSGPTWFSRKFLTPESSHPLVLNLQGMNKGIIFVNGHCLGRFWMVLGTRPPVAFLENSPITTDATGTFTQSNYYVPRWALLEGEKEDNDLIVLDETGGDVEQIGFLEVRYRS
uniref:Beta-galactosidase n=1 Tax=Compsopogon caeruleus TaxID=31354 RepID=A0A6T6CJY4_9RHOD|mmetsp:Transcript_7709/g.15593  ORF Transcript_7709/g.15593 Transcript_7709/m.15593 type:complete len:722 (+) Transcript_7709:240-2405(+)|eukprot:CAMPEP_0184684508 /NCGR_PEP_ID=MMETSP0312-20130426/15564_1 /TAXON_ID=31354 /ORGANISM="Compsopogon coeruleus, Strain SAG 36.94" /LENGTH=721 /DNA_ID=CAMNT_0027137745 /DNA_START=173 /DNA_END=2338 /DNA_ORIENTATION=-